MAVKMGILMKCVLMKMYTINVGVDIHLLNVFLCVLHCVHLTVIKYV